jgi:hypothetical protein
MAPAVKLTARFFVAAAITFAIVGIVDVWIFGPKARVSPQVAILTGFAVGIIFAIIGTLVVGVTAVLLRKRLIVEHHALLVAIGWGIAYAILWGWLSHIVEAWGPDSVVAAAVAWVYLLGFPLLLYWPLWRPRVPPKSNEHTSAL